MDALPYVGTAASVTLMKDIILQAGEIQRAISESTSKEWLMSLAFIPRPDEKMMEAAAELLQQKPGETSIIFSVTALTHTYCSQNSECTKRESVQAIVENIEQTIIETYRRKPFNREMEDRVRKALFELLSRF